MAAFIKVYAFSKDLAEGVHKLGSDTLKIMLTNTAPLVANSVKADLTEIAAGNGYTAGGTVATVVSSSQTLGVYKLVLADVVFTAAGGSIAPARWPVLYNDTHPSKPLIGYWDYGSSTTTLDTETFTVDADPIAGVLTWA